MVVQHNISAMNANRLFGINNSGLSKSLEKLSSGFAINRAGDNAAGLAVSEKMRAQISGLTQASKNAEDGISMIQTFEGALQETDSILQRMRTLAVQSANGSYQDDVDREAIQLEFDQLNDELDQIADTDFNGVVVLNGGQMADGLVAGSDGKFDYTNNARNAKQLGTGDVTKLDSQLIDTKDNANKVWEAVFTDVDRSNVATTDDGPAEFEVTFQYDATADTADKTWKAIDATNGAKADEMTVAGTTNGGFSVTAGGVEFANVVLDQTQLKNGDTITLKVKNPVSPIAAPTNAGATMTSGSITTAGTDTNALKKIEDADLTVTVPTGMTDDKMTQDFKDRYDALQGAEITVSYAADGTESYTIGATAITGTGTAAGTAVTIGGKGFTAYVDGGKLVIQDKNSGTAMLELTATNQTSTTNGSIGSATYTIGIENGKFGTDELPTVSIVQPDTSSVSNSDAFDNSATTLTYSDDITLQVGARTKDAVNFTFQYESKGLGKLKPNMNCSSREDGLGTKALSLSTQKDANKAIDKIDNAINKVSMVRATFGAVQNRLEHKIANLDTNNENLTAAESRIRDTDMAKEMTNFTKNQILSQASQAMLAQANQLPQGVLQLLG